MKDVFTKEDIIRQLNEMNAPKGSVVLMHSSLRSIGNVQGGAEALLDAMIQHFTQGGGLFCVPAHTWDDIDQDITLDMDSSANCLGAFATVALKDDRGIRSESPTHSMVVFGDRAKAEDFIKDEPFISSPTAPESCYGKLYAMGGHVLLVGVSHNRNTYLHAVDELLGTPNRMDIRPIRTTVRRSSGQIVERELTLYYTDYIDDISYRFPKYETAFRYHHCIVDGFLGNAPTQLCDARKMKETVALIFKNSGGADPLCDESPIPPAWYCSK